VYYHSGDATSGLPPSDSQTYEANESALILDSGTLEKNDFAFLGWRYEYEYKYYYDINNILSPGNYITVQWDDINLYPIWDDGLSGHFKFNIENNEALITAYTGEYNPWDITIPETLQGKPVTAIGINVFSNLAISEINFSKNLKHIGIGAFASNNFTFVVIPSSIETIGANAFRKDNLKKITFGAETSLSEIAPYAFASNGLTDIVIPDAITVIGAGAFYENELNQITIGADAAIEDDTAFGVNGASFRALYNIEKKAGLYIYAGNNTWKYY
jgi:hypothetical protein